MRSVLRLLTAVIVAVVSLGVADAAETLPIVQIPNGTNAMRNYFVTNTDRINITAGIVSGPYAAAAGYYSPTNEVDLNNKIKEWSKLVFNWVETQSPTNQFDWFLWIENAQANTLMSFYTTFYLTQTNGQWKVPPEVTNGLVLIPKKNMPLYIPGVTRAVFKIMDPQGTVVQTLDTVNQVGYSPGIPSVDTNTQTLWFPTSIGEGTNGFVTITVSGVSTDYNLNTGKPIVLSLSPQLGAGGRELRMFGRPGSVVTLQQSVTLLDWSDVQVCALPNGECLVLVTNNPTIFYRLRQ